MMPDPFDRAALLLGLAGVASPLFALSMSSNNNFVLIQGAGLAVVPALGACAVVGAAVGIRMLVLAAGVLYLVAAALQLAQFGRSTNWLDGGGSLFALMLGLGIGLLTVALGHRDPSDTKRTE